MMEVNTGSSRSNEKQPLDHTKSKIEGKKPAEKDTDTTDTSLYVNHAANFWHESRKKWVGNPSRRPQPKDPIISWSTAYEDLLSNNEPFCEPIPLPEMVDFLVDIWQEDSLYDK